MGNAGASMQQRERHKSGTDVALPGSPNQALTFDKKPFCEYPFVYPPLNSIFNSTPLPATRDESQEDDEPYYTKTRSSDTPQTDPEFATEPRQRASTVSEGTMPPKPLQPDPVFTTDPIKKDALPTVFKWDGGGKQVFISGTFSNWKALPMVRSHGDFVTIIDLP